MVSTAFRSRRRVHLVLPLLFAGLTALQPAKAVPPQAAQLFPRDTLALVSIDDSRELANRFGQTAIGQMGQDVHMKPLVDQVFKAIEQAAQATQDRLGLSLSDLLKIPQGQVAVGLIGLTDMPPAMVAMIQTGDDTRLVKQLLDRGGATLAENGATQEVEMVAGVEVTVYTLVGGRQRQVAHCQKDGILLVATRVEALGQLLVTWAGEGEPLSQNPHFTAINDSVAGAPGEEPQLRWFLDPVNLARALGQRDAGTQMALALLPTLGLDGLSAVGGSMTFAAEQFDTINRIHVLLDNPRVGVVEMIALGQGEVVPESWAPAEVSNYTTLHWNAAKTYDKLQVLIDSFQGEGAFQAQVRERFLSQSSVDVEREILPALTGRFTQVTLIEEPITPASNAQLIGVQLKDSKRFLATFNRIAEDYRGVSVERTFGGKRYIQYAPHGAPDGEAEVRQRSDTCFCLLGDYLLIGRESVLQKAIMTDAAPGKSLAADLEYKLIASKAQRQAAGSRPTYLNFNRPSESFRFLYGMATSDSTRQGLERRGESNPFFQNLNQALLGNPLPPFGVIQQYFAPGGALLIDDNTGLHYTSFTLRRNTP